MTKQKIPSKDLSNPVRQDLARDLVKNHVYYCQSYLVSELFSKEIIQYDEYENLYLTDEQIKDIHCVETDDEIQEIRDHGEDMQDVYEHWLCSDWLIDKLKKHGEPILETNFQTWWGRTASGQSIELDHNIQLLAYETFEYDDRLYKKSEVA